MNAVITKMNPIDEDDMKSHYDFDYSKSKPNRFAEKYNKMVRHVGLAPGVASMNMDALDDELKPEYDLTKFKVRKVGEGRRNMNRIQLDVDVARVLPDSESVNEALSFLIRITKQHESELSAE